MLNKNKIRKLLGDSMRNLIGLKNVIIFSAVLLSIGSVSAQQAFAGVSQCDCDSTKDGDWNSVFDCGQGLAVPQSSENVCIVNGDNVQLNGVGVAADVKIVSDSLFIGCDGNLTTRNNIFVENQGSLINHGSIDTNALIIASGGLVQNSSSAIIGSIVNNGGTFENISTICSQPIGGTVGSMGTVSLLVAGAQANMGLWSLALVGVAVAVGSGIVYKVKSNKTKEE